MEFSVSITSFACHLKKWPELCLALLCFVCLTSYLRQRNHILAKWRFLRSLKTMDARHVNDWLVRSFNKNGGTLVMKSPLFTRFVSVITCDPNNIEYITKTNSANYPKGTKFSEIFDVLGEGLINADSHKWQLQRKMAHVRLGSKEFRSLYASVSQEVVQEGLLPVLALLARQGSNVDLQDVFMRFSFDSTVSLIFGRNPRYLSIGFLSNELANAVEEASDSILHRILTPVLWWKLSRFLCIGKEKSLAKARRTLDETVKDYIMHLREGGKGNHFLSTFMNPSKEEEEEAKKLMLEGGKFLRDTALTFLVAGRDTISVGLTWFFLLISKNPHVEAKILEELQLVQKNGDGDKFPWVFDSKNLRGLVYLHAALSEALRLYPPAFASFRSVLKEDVLPDGTITKPGMRVMYSIYALGRMKWIWGEDCLEFRPERWIDDNGKLRHESPFKYHVFGAGPRTCVGKDLALTTMKVAAAATIFNFHVQVVDGHPITFKPSVTLIMDQGLMVKIRKREAC